MDLIIPSSVSQLNSSWLSTVLGRSIEVTNVVSVAEGQTQCLKVLVTVRDGEGERNLFVKCFDTRPKDGDEEMISMHRSAQGIECAFYKHIQETAQSFVPTCIASLDSGILILEDARRADFVGLKMQDPPLDIDVMKSIISGYASFHRLFLNQASVPPGVLSQTELVENRRRRWRYSCGAQTAQERMHAFCVANPSIQNSTATQIESLAALGYQPPMATDLLVLQHGDANPNNLFWNAQTHSIVLVDFQEAAVAHPSFDLSWLLITSLEASVRREHQTSLLRQYLSLLGVDKIVDEAQFLKTMKEAIRQHALFILMMVGAVPIDQSNWVGKLLQSCVEVFED